MLGDMRACSGWRRFLLCLPMIFFLPHMLSVLKLQQQLTSQDLYKEKPKKSNHLVLGPVAGLGLADRLQCEGIRALNKTQFSSFSDNSHHEDQISFVTVFTTYNSSADGQDNKKSSELVTVGNISYNKVERSLAILDVFVNFIQAFLETRLEVLSQGQGQVSHYIFTDSDIAVVGDLSQFFHDYPNFHLALTFRNNKDQPLNSGFIAVRGTAEGMRRAKAFLEEVLKVYTSKYMKASRMLGDQLALAWVVKSEHSFDARMFTKKQPFLHEISGSSVLFLPCAVYNWTPPEGAGQFHGMPLDVKVVHFKGSRKRLMLEAWNFLKSSSNSDISDMLCLILSSGRAKYDF